MKITDFRNNRIIVDTEAKSISPTHIIYDRSHGLAWLGTDIYDRSHGLAWLGTDTLI